MRACASGQLECVSRRPSKTQAVIATSVKQTPAATRPFLRTNATLTAALRKIRPLLLLEVGSKSEGPRSPGGFALTHALAG
jgi:hypothetical protein